MRAINWIKSLQSFERHYKTHALQRMFERDIDFSDIDEFIKNPEVIEEYHEDNPLPSCLFLGYGVVKDPLHMVVAFDVELSSAYIITVYRPSEEKWERDFKKRRN